MAIKVPVYRLRHKPVQSTVVFLRIDRIKSKNKPDKRPDQCDQRHIRWYGAAACRIQFQKHIVHVKRRLRVHSRVFNGAADTCNRSIYTRDRHRDHKDQNNDKTFAGHMIGHFFLIQCRQTMVPDIPAFTFLCGRNGVSCCGFQHSDHLPLFQLLQNRHGRFRPDLHLFDACAEVCTHSFREIL